MIDTDKIERIGNEINKLPIYFCIIEYSIEKNKKRTIHKAKKIVAKGNVKSLKTNNTVKRRVVEEHFKGESGKKQKTKNFDLSKINIRSVEVVKMLGYGIKQ